MERKAKIGHILKTCRKGKGWKLVDLALRSGVSVSYIGRCERDERFPSGRILGKLASSLGISEIELFRLAGYLSSESGYKAVQLERCIGFWESLLLHNRVFMEPGTIAQIDITLKLLRGLKTKEAL